MKTGACVTKLCFIICFSILGLTTPANAQLDVLPKEVNFTAQSSAKPLENQVIGDLLVQFICDSNTSEVKWSATTEKEWLSINSQENPPFSGTLNCANAGDDNVTSTRVQLLANGLATDDSAELNFFVEGGDDETSGVTVTVNVSFTPEGEGGGLTVNPTELDLGIIVIEDPTTPPGPFDFQLAVQGVPGSSWAATTDVPWLAVEPAEGTIQQEGPPKSVQNVTLTVAPANLQNFAPGPQEGTVSFVSEGSTATVTVSFLLSTGLTVEPAQIVADFFNSAPQTFEVEVSSGDFDIPDFEWTVTSPLPFVSVSPQSGTGPGTVTITIDPTKVSSTGDVLGFGDDPATDAREFAPGVFFTSSIGTAEVEFSILFHQIQPGLQVSPQQVNLQIISPDFSIRTVPLEIRNANPNTQDFEWSAATNVSWINLDTDPPSGEPPNSKLSGQGPATVLLIIDPGRLTPENISTQPTFTGTVTFQSSLPSDEENILTTVDVTVTIQFIDYGLIVEPSIISVEFTRANLAPKEFVINVRNANPNYQGFVWSAEAPDAGVTVIPDHGSSAGDTMIRIDPASLSLSPPAEETEDGAQQIGRTGSYTVTFRSSLLPQDEDQGEVAATAQVTINVIVYDAQELTVSPSYLFFSVEALPAPEDGSITQPAPEPFTGTVEVQPGFPMVPEFVEQFLQISAGPQGWSASFDAPWLEVNALPGETDLDVFTDTTLSNEFPIGALRVKPLNSVLTQFGRYKSTIRIVDRASGFIREVPVIVEILRPGEESNVPVPPPEYIQNFPGFVLIEAADAHRVNLDLDLSTMEANERVYVLLEAPNLIPGITFAWTPYMPKVLQPVSINGNPVPGADQFFYSAGPIPEVPIKNLYLRGLAGRIMIRTQVGENLANSREMQRVQLNVSTPIGRWQITDRLAGESYTYDSEITHQIVAEPVDGYASTWGNTHVVVSYGDTRTHLYRIQFQQEGIGYIYDVISLTPNEMVGRWEFAGEGVGSGSQDFWGQRILSIR